MILLSLPLQAKTKSKHHGSVKRGLVDMSVTIFMYAHTKTDSKHEICLTIHFPRMFVLSSSFWDTLMSSSKKFPVADNEKTNKTIFKWNFGSSYSNFKINGTLASNFQKDQHLWKNMLKTLNNCKVMPCNQWIRQIYKIRMWQLWTESLVFISN